MNYKVVIAISCLLFSVACSKTDDGSEATSNVSESAMSEAGAQSSSTEGASSPSLMSVNDLAEEVQSMDYVDPRDATVHSYSACAFSTARSNCTSNVDTLDWGGCTLGSFAALTGGWTETWTAGFCPDGTKPTALTNTNSVTRTSPNGETLTITSGVLTNAKLVTNTVGHTAWDGTSIPSTGITTAMAVGVRTTTINGLHRIMTGPHGKTWFDHSLTSSGLSVSGTRAAGTRQVTGNLTLYHNIAKYTAVHTFNNVQWTQSTCCYPTSGQIDTNFTAGSKSGTAHLVFSSTCGQATFTDTTGASSSVTLTQCR